MNEIDWKWTILNKERMKSIFLTSAKKITNWVINELWKNEKKSKALISKRESEAPGRRAPIKNRRALAPKKTDSHGAYNKKYNY